MKYDTKRVKNNKLLVLMIIHIILFVFVSFILTNLDLQGNSLLFTYFISIIVFIWCFLTAYIFEKKLGSPYVMYLIMYFICLFGQLTLRVVFHYDNPRILEMIDYYSSSIIIKATILSLYCLMGMHLGVLVYYLFGFSRNFAQKRNNVYDNDIYNILRYMGWLLVIISIKSSLSLFYNNFILASIRGYIGVYSNVRYGLESVDEKIAQYFFIGLITLMIAYKEQISISKTIFIFGMIFYGLQIFWGARGFLLLQVITLIWVWHNFIKPISKRVFLFGIILFYPISSILVLIRLVREFPLTEWVSNISFFFIEAVKENPILSIITELGTAIGPTAAAICLIPYILPYGKGISYLYSIFMIVPNFNVNSPNQAMLKANVPMIISDIVGVRFGGSIIEEAFYNFGWLSWMFFIGIGFLIAFFSSYIYKIKNPFVSVLLYSFIPNLLWTVRNAYYPIPREILYNIIFPLIAYYIIKKFYQDKLSYRYNIKVQKKVKTCQ
ncbi:O-antigen polysaccharide polymerase Wzy [Caldicellulosiruptor morganii]|uniref:O-antigen polysaccharide polymerase Wzy family protein n=1 Tax=Caldicellulosiruptor morganii TaxID=1387555 RepID=A0ABY7BLB2_9FIRM|nr:O-antigen polysaccharide polymerase Wzy [Caldicellulosiruptor morganii]WAM33633.1 O-antigen polysaccharide polymerase Wzy family protein [Caldicellulosiruptor morganii]